MRVLLPDRTITRTRRSNGSTELDARIEPDGRLHFPGSVVGHLAIRGAALYFDRKLDSPLQRLATLVTRRTPGEAERRHLCRRSGEGNSAEVEPGASALIRRSRTSVALSRTERRRLGFRHLWTSSAMRNLPSM